MKLLEFELKNIFKQAISKIYNNEIINNLTIQETNNLIYGDYQTNFAMINAKILKSSPRKIAEKIVNELKENNIIEKIEIAGPGFINIFIKNSYLIEYIKKISSFNYDYEVNTSGDVIIDYSSPNIAKKMHIGHLRSTVIGDALKRIYKFMGFNVIGDNHIGDWGTHFGKLIVAYNKWLNKENYKNNPVEELERLYVEFIKKADEDNSLDDLAREELRKLQHGDEENKKLWEEFIKVSLEEYDIIYKRMDIEFDTYYGESFYHDLMGTVVDELTKKNIVKESEGALIVDFDEKENLPVCLIRKSNGAYLYTTSDLACIKFRRDNYNINKLIYVTDQRQQTHFKQVFKISDMLEWNDEKIHVYFGLMRFAEGVFSTRKGNVIELRELLNKAKDKAKDILIDRNSKGDLDYKAEIIGIGAVKYADLSQNRTSDIIFEWDKILSFNSNSSPYLQYTYARINSVIKKSEVVNFNSSIVLKNDFEILLAKKIMRFPTIVLRSAESYKPNLITDYLYELAQFYNSFYNNVPILKANEEEKNSRLLLSKISSDIIKKGLYLLGINVLEEM